MQSARRGACATWEARLPSWALASQAPWLRAPRCVSTAHTLGRTRHHSLRQYPTHSSPWAASVPHTQCTIGYVSTALWHHTQCQYRTQRTTCEASTAHRTLSTLWLPAPYALSAPHLDETRGQYLTSHSECSAPYARRYVRTGHRTARKLAWDRGAADALVARRTRSMPDIA